MSKVEAGGSTKSPLTATASEKYAHWKKYINSNAPFYPIKPTDEEWLEEVEELRRTSNMNKKYSECYVTLQNMAILESTVEHDLNYTIRLKIENSRPPYPKFDEVLRRQKENKMTEQAGDGFVKHLKETSTANKVDSWSELYTKFRKTDDALVVDHKDRFVLPWLTKKARDVAFLSNRVDLLVECVAELLLSLEQKEKQVNTVDLTWSNETGIQAIGRELVPRPGTKVKADHPIGQCNPTEYFIVKEVKWRDNGFYVRGNDTCWFPNAMIYYAEPK
jgi:hypothetical protein